MSRLNHFTTDTLSVALTQRGGVILTTPDGVTIAVSPSDAVLLQRVLTGRAQQRGGRGAELPSRVLQLINKSGSNGISEHQLCERLRENRTTIAAITQNLHEQGSICSIRRTATNGRTVTYWLPSAAGASNE